MRSVDVGSIIHWKTSKWTRAWEDNVEKNEEALIRAAQINPQAFDVLYQRYVTRLYLYIRANVKSNEDASDLTQQAFLQALTGLPNYKFQGVTFAAWLFRIARHLVINLHTRHRETLSWEALPESRHPTVEHGPEAAVVQQETYARLKVLLAELDPYKRDLLALRFAGELSSAEIATVVGKSSESVKKQLTRMLQTLKEKFDER
jgi:RNA polymerase sigma-70 factor (ECF subfamily)